MFGHNNIFYTYLLINRTHDIEIINQEGIISFTWESCETHKKVGKHVKHINPLYQARKSNYLDVFGSLKPS